MKLAVVATRPAIVLACSTLLLLAACGDKAKAPTQAAAKVNSGEITVHQINQVLEQQRNLRPEQVDAASREALERLIDQELTVQQATEGKLDREPRVVAAIEAAKRDILSRAYLERVGESTAKPSQDEVQAYYAQHPGLFGNRRIYTLLEVNVQVPPEQLAEAQDKARNARSSQEFLDWVKAKGLAHGANQAVQPAESVPLSVVETLASTPEGHGLVLPLPQGMKALFVLAAKPEPVALERARPAIEQFIANDRKRAAVAAEVQRLRTSAKVEYLGKFAASTPATGTPEASPPPAATTPAPEAASGALSPEALKKGLGLK